MQFVGSKLFLSVNGTIHNIIPGDINYDGQLDILLTYSDATRTFTQVVLQFAGIFLAQEPLEITGNTQPVLLDINGDLLLEVLVPDTKEAKVYKFTYGLQEINQIGGFVSNSTECLSYESVVFSSPHSIGFVDLNKDCLADLFLTVYKQGVVYFEVWLNMMNGVYCKVQSDVAPEGTRQVTFVDIDRNGSEDIVFPVCIGENCSKKQEIHIVFNRNDNSQDCSYSKVSSSDFKFLDLSALASTDYKTIIPVTSNTFFAFNSDFPVTLRFGDFNLDGYPDALATMLDSKTQTSYVEFFENSKCDQCGKGGRTLKIPEGAKMEKLTNIKGAVISCFFDLDDNGILDIIVVSFNSTQYVVTSFYNNNLNDAFHLKTLALNGHHKRGYSSAFPGAVFMFTLTELDMSKVVMHSTQMPLTGYFALNTPYCVYGLGRTNSYIEEFYVAMPVNSTFHRAWTPIIPNSYLIASTGTKTTDDWYLELFASPTDKIGIIIGVCLVCMALIGAIVIYNYCREKREDRVLFGIRF